MVKLKRDLKKLGKRLGFTRFDVSVSGGSHYRIETEYGLFFTGFSPSDQRGIKNLERDLKKAHPQW